MTNYVTPIGISNYTHIDKPDTKFDTDGTYHGEILCNYSDCVELLDKLDNAFDGLYSAMLKEKKLQKMPIYTRGYTDYIDDKGNKKVKFKFKTKAVITTKKGDTYDKVIPVYDDKGNIITDLQPVGNGSKIRVSFELFPYYASICGFGVTLRLKALQLIDLVPYVHDTFETFGFEKTDEAKQEEGAVPFPV